MNPFSSAWYSLRNQILPGLSFGLIKPTAKSKSENQYESQYLSIYRNQGQEAANQWAKSNPWQYGNVKVKLSTLLGDNPASSGGSSGGAISGSVLLMAGGIIVLLAVMKK